MKSEKIQNAHKKNMYFLRTKQTMNLISNSFLHAYNKHVSLFFMSLLLLLMSLSLSSDQVAPDTMCEESAALVAFRLPVYYSSVSAEPMGIQPIPKGAKSFPTFSCL